MTEETHNEITAVVTANGTIPYGVGIDPNPYAAKQPEWLRRVKYANERAILTNKIVSLFEPRFVSTPEIAEVIEGLVTMTDARQVLEIGMHTGFTSLHILRALYGKVNAGLWSIDARLAHDRTFFEQELLRLFTFVEGWTPEVFKELAGLQFDLVFVDSDHSDEHTRKEFEALMPLTHPGTIFLFHDVQEFRSKDDERPHPARMFVEGLVKEGRLKGLCLPSCQQADCEATWGVGYPKQCNPGLGVFIRT